MSSRQLILLSPNRYPAQHPLTLANEDMAAWLCGYSALWHPLSLCQGAGPVRVESPQDHEAPRANHLYALPAHPASLLPADWHERLQAVGAIAFKATSDRDTTIANLKAAVADCRDEHSDLAQHLAALPDLASAPFFGVGLGYLLLSALSDGMEHENLLEHDAFWSDLQDAIASLAAPANEKEPNGREHAQAALQSAARRLLVARESLYPVAIHLLDMISLSGVDAACPRLDFGAEQRPVNVIASGAALELLHRDNPEAMAALAAAVRHGHAVLCGGNYIDRQEALLPLESQWWNLRKGLEATRQLVGEEITIFAQSQGGAHVLLPSWLGNCGINRALAFGLEDVGLPVYSSPLIAWNSPEGQELVCFVRKPQQTDSVAAFFNLGHNLFKTTREDHIATLAFLSGDGQGLHWFGDLLELLQLAPVIGTWTTLASYFTEAASHEHAGSLGPDDFSPDELSARVPASTNALPVSGFASHARLRRRLDSCWTLAAMQQALGGGADGAKVGMTLSVLEDQLELAATRSASSDWLKRFAECETSVAGALAQRLLSKAQENQQGFLLLNPCSFMRRVALELDANHNSIPVGDPVMAVQTHDNKTLVIAEIPALGFAWFPSIAAREPLHPASRLRLADERCVRNEFFEAEIDTQSGGLRAIRDHKNPVNRLSQRLIFRPGSAMRAETVKTTSTGPALGEIITQGVLLDALGDPQAKFVQRFRAWLGRPVLDLRIEITPLRPPAGEPWRTYYGAQFAWRDERALLLRGVGGAGYVSSHPRPLTPDFLEIREARHSTTIFPGGLPFHQREGARMLDVILRSPGEPAGVFDLAVGLDREHPMQTAQGFVTPGIVVPTAKGPPHVGNKGWLFHLDAPNILLSSMRPGGRELLADGSGTQRLTDAVTARLLECTGFSTSAELRCVRDPKRVAVLDARGQLVMDGAQRGDAALLQIGPSGFLHLQVEFSK